MLNPQQLEAVDQLEGPVLVIAGAGSGKTKVVTLRIVKLLESGVSSHQILGLTFTNKAAEEMKERVNKLTRENVLICTFHSLGARILRESIQHLGFKRDFTIYDEDDSLKLLASCLDEMNLAIDKKEIKTIRYWISAAKNELKYADDAFPELSPSERIFPQIYAAYQRKLLDCHAVDFDDLLFLPVRLFKEHPEVLQYYQSRWTHILIDEYQDTNQAQYEMVYLLVGTRRNICAVGDPDQSIYSWRGAKIRNILNFENDFPGAKIIQLEQNYRSHTNILEAANALISYNYNRYEKNLWSDKGPGEKIKLFTAENDREEVYFVIQQIYAYYSQERIPLSEMVIFYRTNSQSRIFEDALLASKMPYTIVGGISFYQRREIKDILGFLRMVHSGTDYVSFLRTVNIPKRGVGQATLDKIRMGAIQSNLSMFEYCSELMSGVPLVNAVKLTAKQKEGLSGYVELIKRLKSSYASDGLLPDLVRNVVEWTAYDAILKEEKETYQDRKSNVNELVTKAAEWQMANPEAGLGAFLEELSLKSNLDEAEMSEDRLSLMTLHNGKGLEYKVVFLVGMEEDLFPHINSKESLQELEEERRLCYVGMTRAKEFLYITRAKIRNVWGSMRSSYPSRFLKEIPTEYTEIIRGKVNVGRQREPAMAHKERVSAKAVPSEPLHAMNVGDAIFHQEFGIGIIQRVYEGSVGLTYEVLFSKDQISRNLVAKYANLTRL